MFTKIFDYRILRYVTLVLYGILCLLIYRMLAYLNSYDLTANDDNSTAARHPPLRHAAPFSAPTISASSMDEESRDMYNAWNAPISLGVFINPEATPEDVGKASKRADTPFHQSEGSGSGSGGSYFTADSAKRDEVPHPSTDKKQANVKKSTIETVSSNARKSDFEAESAKTSSNVVESDEKKSELNAKASKIEEVQGGSRDKVIVYMFLFFYF